MDTLRIKFELHALKSEVEGQQDVAEDEFRNFNENILTQLLAKVNVVQSGQTISYPPSTNQGAKELPEAIIINPTEGNSIGADFPILKDIKIRDLPKTEVEWVLIYMFYASNFGTNEFTRGMILKLYKETDRRTDNRIKDLSKNFKSALKAKYIKSTNDTNFIVLPTGSQKVIEILEGKSKTKDFPKKLKKINDKDEPTKYPSEKKVKLVSHTVPFTDLKFDINEMESIRNFFKSKLTKTQNDEVVVLVRWYEEHKESSGATLEEINYLMKISTNRVPSALGQVLINMKGPKLNLLKKDESGKYKLTSLGILHANTISQNPN